MTPLGINKLMTHFADSLDHATYELQEQTVEIPIIKEISPDDGTLKVSVVFAENITGQIGNVKLIDQDGDIVGHAKRIFIKPAAKTLYTAFRYKLVEMEV